MLQVGSLVDGKYKILSKIGHGGMSVVYMAINEKANKTWAIKEVRKDGKMDFNVVKQGLVAEIETLKKLNHPNLPSIVDVIEDEETFIIVMDYIEGRSLDRSITEYGAQPQENVIAWAKQLCDVLGYLHTRTPMIVYRDMKPANVMLRPDGSIMVIDFGTAKTAEVNLGETTGIGTIGYAAPEQYTNSGYGRTDGRTDIYCLGMTLYHLLTGVDPCKSHIPDTSVRLINPSLSAGIEQIVRKCTAIDPNKRYQSCAELLYDLEHFEEIDEGYRKKQKNRFRIFFAMGALAVIFTATGFGLQIGANQQATDTYAVFLEDAAKAANYEEKIELYQNCVNVPNKAGEKDAYIGMIQAFKENDSAFTTQEQAILVSAIRNHKDALLKNQENYVDICFETGKLFWYYYAYGDGSDNQVTKMKSAVDWFSDVIAYSKPDYTYLGMATVYRDIGIFYRDISINTVEASDKGVYLPFYENLTNLVTSMEANEKESEIVKLELYELSRSALQQYATKFKADGVSKEQMMGLYGQVNKAVRSLETTTEKTAEKKNDTVGLLVATEKSIETAFGAE